jgi:integrase/recombinase XerD
MPTIKPLLDTRDRKADKYPIIVYVYHRYKKRYLPTGYRVEKKCWTKGEVVRHPDAAIINSKIAGVINDIKTYFAECQLKKKPVNLELLGQNQTGYALNAFLTAKAAEYAKKDQPVMSQKTMRIAKDIKDCFGRDILFDELTPAALRQLDTHLSAKNIAITRRGKFLFLGDWYDQAMKDGKAPAPNPFDDYNITGKPVKKTKLTTAEIEAIENLVIPPGPVNDARNLFLFAYYCKGQRFRVCVTAKKSDIRNGRIYIKTDKGGKYISIKIHERLQRIIDYYKDVPEFIFPYVKELPGTKRGLITLSGNLNADANVHLKTVAELAGIKINLTFHIARHTFAFHFKKKTKNINVIQKSLGHSDQRTTLIYLEELDDEELDSEVEKLYGK